MGEDPSLVWVTGAPGLDTILHEPLPPTAELRARYGLQDEIGFVLFVMHPVSTDPGGASAEVRHALEGTLALGLPVIAIAPNSDAGGEAMRSALQQHESLMLYPSLPHRDFLGLLRDASALVGNSSSGIIESPSIRTPVVNVGPRQAGRERAVKVIDVDPDRDAVRKGLLHVLNDPAYREGLAHIENPYGDGRAAERIAQILATVEIDAKLRRKKLTY
jgi:UDP-hydrolysing UDP-N-acetyl-D-glucosamine 2-epimerase